MKKSVFPHTNNKYVLIVIGLLVAGLARSQEYSAGLKGGANYSLNDNGSEIFGSEGLLSAESGFGYQGGVFLEVEFGKFFVRPEVFYNHTTGDFVFSQATLEYSVDKISVPLLLGYNIYGPLDIYAGPAYQFLIDKSLENTRDPLENDHNNLASQVGIKIVFNRLEVDLRYDFTFPSEDSQVIDVTNVMNNAFMDDGRLNQLMLSLNYKLFGTNIQRRPRGGSCYF